ncbi:response regulator [Parashewanella spongiae]|uniref:histidine kinase n=1 Tax=Parashewanella spongiae TaxID=342950 RepID=A0A3A6TGT6_9GAMM|nr:PAS domain-containing hybrid sensor histidine kinase/response regulator [Parashewanella spongiae]MCL1079171.1 hybrid sensor histidine kinase/response regulator [Parashewanella spongiae]RJY10575.1 response regulator [Parashewanella spongiae]
MFANWQLIMVSVIYAILLSGLAIWGNKHRHKITHNQQKLIYAFSLGVYCTSWSFLGISGQAAHNAYSFLPVYIIPALFFIFGWGFIQRVIRVSLTLNSTSVADLLANRFGKSQKLAVLISFSILIGTLPYLALQIKAIVSSYELLRQDNVLPDVLLGLVVTAILASFTILFGVRNIDVTERHLGIMIAIAFESILKLLTFLTIGLFVSFYLFDSPLEIWRQATENQPQSTKMSGHQWFSWIGLSIIVFSAFLCLPRQFQTMIVEAKDANVTATSRWLFPIYILLFALFAIPLGQAGKLLYAESLNPDAYVLFLPAFNGHSLMSLVGFIGTISAASAMVVVSTIAISTMLSNEVVFPTILKRKQFKNSKFEDFKTNFLVVRKVLVLLILALSFLMYSVAPPEKLATLGEIAFGAIAQIGPAFFAAFLWRKANFVAVFSGMFIGIGLWLVLNLLPIFGFYSHPFIGFSVSHTTLATLISLLTNVLFVIALSYLSRQSIQEQVQLEHFFEKRGFGPLKSTGFSKVSIDDLLLIISKFVGEEKSKQANIDFKIITNEIENKAELYHKLINHTEMILASVMGSTSARLVLASVFEGRQIDLAEMAYFIQHAENRQQKFSQYILQSAIENANDGISVIDKDLKIVAWNKAYLDLFNYPDDLVYIGCPVAELIKHNLIYQGKVPLSEVEEQVEKRIGYILQGSVHNTERSLANGSTIRIKGNSIPGGGFVMSFTDVTLYRKAEQVLQEKNLDLESLVSERTEALEQANVALSKSNQDLGMANQKIHIAHKQKTNYLKACSHDLMQPVSAARLFISALMQDKSLNKNQLETVKHIESSINNANDLIKDLNEISQIESGTITPQIEEINVDQLFLELFNEFELSCLQQNIFFKFIPTKLHIESDKKLLKRILQNLLSNACRYAPNSRLLLGCRRKGDFIEINVIDTGPGIPLEKHDLVFEQFVQLENRSATGLGLGLNISKGFCQLLGHQLSLKSNAGKGCNFSVLVPLSFSYTSKTEPFSHTANLKGLTVHCIDNEPQVTSGMEKLLTVWGCKVITSNSVSQALHVTEKFKDDIDLLLVDYQLEDDISGLGVIQKIRQDVAHIPAILITATLEKSLEQTAKKMDIEFMAKADISLELQTKIGDIIMQFYQKNYYEKE